MKSAFNDLSLKKKNRIDFGLLLAVTICAVVGILLIHSIGYNKVVSSVDSSTVKTQIFSAIIGLGVSLLVAVIDYKKIAKLWFIYVPISLGLVLLTFTSLGYKREGADDQAWLDLGFTTLQPSEILKLAFILSFAFHLSKVEDKMNEPLRMLLLCFHVIIPIGLIGLQGDYGTAIVFGFIFGAIMISAKISWKYLVATPILLVGAVFVLWNFVLGSVHKKRILVLMNPGSDPEGLEWQQNLGLASLSSGGLFGKGLFNKDVTYISVPEIHNDFIFSYIGQVFGFIGTVGILIILVYICLKILADANSASDNLGKFICMGVLGMLVAHYILNIGMVLKIMPVIGIPLPFISAGGTALVSMYVAIGIVMSTFFNNRKKHTVFFSEE